MRGLNPKEHSRQRKPCVQRHKALRIADVMVEIQCGWGTVQCWAEAVEDEVGEEHGPGCEGTCMPC